MSDAAIDDQPGARVRAPRWRLLGPVVLVVGADWLIYGHGLGLNLAVFLVVLTGTALACGPRPADVRATAVAGLVFLATLVPLVYAATLSAVVLATLAAAHLALAANGLGGMALVDRLGRAAALVLDGCGRIAVDLLGRKAPGPAHKSLPLRARGWVGWIVPVVFGVAFLLLFRSANPLVDGWLSDIAPDRWFARLRPDRVMFWIAVVVVTWPFLMVVRPLSGRLLSRAAAALTVDVRTMLPQGAWSDGVFGTAAVLRSLVLFNLMFAVQTGLDLAYLWGGLTLPDGMSYAGYAHRGAYPLVATALLAAVFVLIAMRAGSASSRSRAVRALVFVWVAQNVLLVVSSMLRLDLYVAVYSLTYLRVAALVWMLLVAAGLLLIVLRIALGRSNRWLVSMNLLALLATLYVCSFVNMPAVIAGYNVDHSRAMVAEGRPLDLGYLEDLGPQAIPALDRYLEAVITDSEATEIRGRLAYRHVRAMRDWRGWTVREAWLGAYLAGRTEPLAAWDGPVERH